MSKKLPAVILPTTAIEIFSCNKIDDLISAIEKQARSIVPDLSSDKGRKAIASNAAAVSRSKTALDALGKDLVSGWKSKAKVVDVERKEMRDRLDTLRDEVRKPLTDWDAKQIAIAAKKIVAKKLLEDHADALTENKLFNRERDIAIKEAEQAKAEQDRIDREAAEQAKADRIAHNTRIAKEATERAEREATAAIKAAEDATKQAELEKIEAEQREKIQAENAERERVEAIERARVAAENAEIEKKEAIERARQNEVDRQAEEKRKADEAQAKIESDKRHIGKIRKEAKECLMEFDGINETLAKRIVLAIHRGEIRNLTINY